MSVATQKWKDEYVDALICEISRRTDFFEKNAVIDTVYFGGGTPSLLSIQQVQRIFNVIRNNFDVSESAEITFEMNPEDVEKNYLKGLADVGINRLTIGVQSFIESELRYLGRNHDVQRGVNAFALARQAGFQNICIDFLFGLPAKYSGDPQVNIEQVIKLKPEHISAYGLTMEPDTILLRQVEKDKMLPPDDEVTAQQFMFYMEQLAKLGYEHYEISSYALPGFRSKHNSAYWKNVPYLGVGAGAHSYNLQQRWWNTGVITDYIQGVNKNTFVGEAEILSEKDKYNDYIITSARTIEGMSLPFIREFFGDHYVAYFLKQIKKYAEKQYLYCKADNYILTDIGKLWSDEIAEHLMIENLD